MSTKYSCLFENCTAQGQHLFVEMLSAAQAQQQLQPAETWCVATSHGRNITWREHNMAGTSHGARRVYGGLPAQ